MPPAPTVCPPLGPDDWTLLIESPVLWMRHRSRRPYGDDHRDGHDGYRPSECQECRVLAFHMLASANRTLEGKNRQEAHAELRAHPGLAKFWLEDALRSERVGQGLVARPGRVASSKAIRDSLDHAYAAGHLDCDVETATTLLVEIIWSVGDETGPAERGHFLPYDHLARRLAREQGSDASFDGPSAAEVAHWVEQIFAALAANPRTARLLERHVFAPSALLSRHIAEPVSGEDTESFEPAEAQGSVLTERLAEGSDRLVDELTSSAAGLLVRAGRCDAATARSAVRRAVSDRLGPDLSCGSPDDVDRLIASVARSARTLAARDLAEAEARRILDARELPTLEQARVVLAEVFSVRPEALPPSYRRPAGREAYEKFLTRRARRLLADLGPARGRLR
ncbi:MAG: hypothetical protein M0T80_09110 [Actinomycetota bacterium]|nr:hypothetical protein [Actinomycetota bacterium]